MPRPQKSSGAARGGAKKASKKAASSRKAAAKKAPSRKAARKLTKLSAPAPKKAGKRSPAASGKPRAAAAAPRADSTRAIVDAITMRAHTADDDSADYSDLVERLEAVATAADLPLLLGLLTTSAPHDVCWAAFFLAENFDDLYLDALLATLTDLVDHAPEWAETAVIRVLNTRGEADDCTAAFEKAARRAPAATRKALRELLQRMTQRGAAELHGDQLASIRQTLAAIGAARG